MTVHVTPVTEADGEDLCALFERAASPCFCQYWHFVGSKNDWLARCALSPEDNRSALLRALAEEGSSARGLVARTPSGESSAPVAPIVGWLKLTARSYIPKLRALPVYRALDLGPEDTTFSIACILVDPALRNQGVARTLVEQSVGWATRWGGRAIEAYPRRANIERLHDEEAFQGPERLYVDLGFEAVHELGPYPVYRKVLGH